MKILIEYFIELFSFKKEKLKEPCNIAGVFFPIKNKNIFLINMTKDYNVFMFFINDLFN